MGFRPSKSIPQFADLKSILSQSKKTDNALYEVIQLLIERMDQLKDVLVSRLDKLEKNVVTIEETIIVGPMGPPGLDGIDGIDGRNGMNGINGINGIQGPPGMDGEVIYNESFPIGTTII